MNETPIIFIHDNKWNRIGLLDNQAKNAMHYYNDTFTRSLLEGASAFEFTVPKTHDDVNLLNEQSYISFRYDEQDFLMKIMRTEEDEFHKNVIAYNLNLELINESVYKYSADKAYKIVDYLRDLGGKPLEYTAVEIGLNEVSDKSIKCEWEGTDSKLARVLSILNKFDAEGEFITKLDRQGKLEKIVLNIYKKNDGENTQGVGEDRRDITLTYGKNVRTIKRTVSIEKLFTAIRVRGKDGTNIKGIAREWKDKEGRVEFFTTQTSDTISAPLARERFWASQTSDGYILEEWEYDSDNKETLTAQGYGRLKKNCEPAVEYEVDGFYNVGIGDTILIHDEGYTPTLALKARVSKQEVSFTEPSRNRTTFSNFKALENKMSTDLLSRMNQLIDEITPYRFEIVTSNGVSFKNDEGTTELQAIVFKGQDVVPLVMEEIEWFKTLPDGTEISLITTGNTCPISAHEVSGRSKYRYEATYKGVVIGGAEVTLTNVKDGDDGVKISSIEQKYQVTSSESKPTQLWENSVWQTSPIMPSATNRYLWKITRTTYANPSGVIDLVELVSVRGETGAKGDTGEKGNTGATGPKGETGTQGPIGRPAVTANLTNENVTLPANVEGGITSYENSGVSISVAEGTLIYTPTNNATLSNGQFKVSVSASNLNEGSKTVDTANKCITYGNISNFIASETIGKLIFTIDFKSSWGETGTLTKIQTFSKAKAGVAGVNSYTWIRYSANANGSSMTQQPNVDTKYIGVYAGTSASAPTAATSYTWSNYKGNPTGVTVNTNGVEPSEKYVGMLVQYLPENNAPTSTTWSGSSKIEGTSIYRYTGTKWELWYFYASNIQADLLLANRFTSNNANTSISISADDGLQATKTDGTKVIDFDPNTGELNLQANSITFNMAGDNTTLEDKLKEIAGAISTESNDREQSIQERWAEMQNLINSINIQLGNTAMTIDALTTKFIFSRSGLLIQNDSGYAILISGDKIQFGKPTENLYVQGILENDESIPLRLYAGKSSNPIEHLEGIKSERYWKFDFNDVLSTTATEIIQNPIKYYTLEEGRTYVFSCLLQTNDVVDVTKKPRVRFFASGETAISKDLSITHVQGQYYILWATFKTGEEMFTAGKIVRNSLQIIRGFLGYTSGKYMQFSSWKVEKGSIPTPQAWYSAAFKELFWEKIGRESEYDMNVTAEISGDVFHIPNGQIMENLQVANHIFTKENDGHTVVYYVDD
ncbi:Prophage endopeptidase tail [Pilibacter termitis]|uniref:Prophage endopeptidase tail n=1 Tax=Pilibacter termitis TaxID=263852 RepID=A0A1T4PEK7_9ENTE|nr:phage tail spike protein [Pilibacter termitis]SJZ89984.1 Prophage endopeptidase tail [Pilibacter termitis]